MQSPSESNGYFQDQKDMLTYLYIFCGVISFLLIALIIYIFRYKRNINRKIKRLEQVKDMQSLEASNHIPLTTVNSSGHIEDKRYIYSQSSSSRRTPMVTESLSLKSAHSNVSVFDDGYLYPTEFDYNGGQNYLTPSQVFVNKSLGLKYNKPPIEQVNVGYENTFHNPLNVSEYPNKNEHDGLYSRTVDPYDTDEDIVSSMGPRSMIYDTGAGISSIHNMANIYNTHVVSTPTSIKTVVPNHNQSSLGKLRVYNHSLPNLAKIGYETEMAYSTNYNNGLMKYNTSPNQPISPMTPKSPMTPMTPKSPISPKTVVGVGGYPQLRVDTRNRRRSHSIDITKNKRASYIESIGKRSPNNYSTPRTSPKTSNRRNSTVSESRSAKSILIDQMVQAMDMEAESDDTLSNYDSNETYLKSKSSKPKIITIPKDTSPTSILKSTTTTTPYQKAKVTNISTSSSSSLQKNSSQITESSKADLSKAETSKTESSRTFINIPDIEEIKFNFSDDDANETSGVEIPSPHKKIRKELLLRSELFNHDFTNTTDFESDSLYESNNSFNKSIYDEVRVFEVEED